MILYITGSDNDLHAVGKSIGASIEDNMLTIPESLGHGYIKSFALSSFMKIITAECVFNEDITFKRHSIEHEEIITLGFRNMAYYLANNNIATKPLPSVFVSRTDFEIEFLYPVGTAINLTIIIIKISALKEMLYADGTIISQLQTIFLTNQPFHFEEVMSPKLQDIATQMQRVEKSDPLHLFYCRIKAEEMIYLFFQTLLKRKDLYSYAFNNEDVKMMHQIGQRLVQDFSKIPNLPKLAAHACMSESKMKKLFKQIFGKSIYNYYQYFRMQEAARLIQEGDCTISQAGHQVGFTSLSHFTKVFESHIGQKPKKYSKEISNSAAYNAGCLHSRNSTLVT